MSEIIVTPLDEAEIQDALEDMKEIAEILIELGALAIKKGKTRIGMKFNTAANHMLEIDKDDLTTAFILSQEQEQEERMQQMLADKDGKEEVA